MYPSADVARKIKDLQFSKIFLEMLFLTELDTDPLHHDINSPPNAANLGSELKTWNTDPGSIAAQ